MLPTRVIHIDCHNEAISVSLFESNGKRRHYVALSHCWGPPAHRPLMTTTAALASHTAGIPWDSLPTTYQHAIAATHRLGFSYIWIDSLCILQDSYADWLTESRSMGDVYQYARLTIAASHAADSSQPCFFTRSPPLPTIRLDHTNDSGNVDGSIFASLLPPDYAAITPESGALAYRAWATQEWLLSRRMVFFTAESLVWSCKTITQRETGASFHSTARNHRWKNIVEKYSARLLTEQRDRLVAIDGVRAAMSKKRPEDTYCLGLWKNSMPDQLLWYPVQPAGRSSNELKLPTWTWASSLHGVHFLNIKGAKNMCEGFRFDEAAHTLTVRGVVRKIPKGSLLPTADVVPPVEAIPTDTLCKNLPAGMLSVIKVDDGQSSGWSLLDEGTWIDEDIHCLRLMSKTTRSRDAYGTNTYTEEWVLLLRGLDTTPPARYERIGVARLASSNPWFQDLVVSNVVIV